MLREKIELLQKDLTSFSLPQKGNFSLFNQIKLQQSFLRDEINNFKEQISVLEKRKKELLEKKAYLTQKAKKEKEKNYLTGR